MPVIVSEEISSMMLPTVRTSQTIGLDVVTAMQTIESLVKAFVAFGHEEVFTKLLMVAATSAASLSFEIRRPRIRPRSKYRRNCGGTGISMESYFR